MLLAFGTTPTVQQTMVFARIIPDEVNRAAEVRRSASGKPINVARVLHTLGEKATLCIPLGGDTGQFVAQDLARAEIDADIIQTAHPTRTCVTMVDRQNDTATELVEEHAELSAGVPEKILQSIESHLTDCRMLIGSGTLAPGSGDDFYARCCRLANPKSVPVILDARGGPLLRALECRPLLVKPNRSELAATLGRTIDTDDDLRAAIVGLIQRGAQWALITMGKNGAILSDGKTFWKIPGISVSAISPIGSGDAFTAGLASAIVAGREVPDACRLGAACAAANTLIPGAGFLNAEDVRRLEPLARIEKQ
jgi:1-phosphofructokinase family hexose kinase